jgi:GntR family transcriptional regulator, transcriptional repressor for pyruvate dehydrogenase complex
VVPPASPTNARLSDKVAGELLASITERGMRPGDKLPSERELGEQFGVSRTVVREAVRALAAKGVIDARTGSGLRVAEVPATAVSESMSLYLRGRASLDYAQIHEVRSMVEVEVAARAAERATAADIERLREVCERMAESLDDLEWVSQADVDFHRTLAELTHNELYVIMLDSIGDVLLEIRRATLGVTGRPLKGLRAHRKILRAVERHDPAAAREAMRVHLADSATVWQTSAA